MMSDEEKNHKTEASNTTSNVKQSSRKIIFRWSLTSEGKFEITVDLVVYRTTELLKTDWAALNKTSEANCIPDRIRDHLNNYSVGENTMNSNSYFPICFKVCEDADPKEFNRLLDFLKQKSKTLARRDSKRNADCIKSDGTSVKRFAPISSRSDILPADDLLPFDVSPEIYSGQPTDDVLQTSDFPQSNLLQIGELTPNGCDLSKFNGDEPRNGELLQNSFLSKFPGKGYRKPTPENVLVTNTSLKAVSTLNEKEELERDKPPANSIQKAAESTLYDVKEPNLEEDDICYLFIQLMIDLEDIHIFLEGHVADFVSVGEEIVCSRQGLGRQVRLLAYIPDTFNYGAYSPIALNSIHLLLKWKDKLQKEATKLFSYEEEETSQNDLQKAIFEYLQTSQKVSVSKKAQSEYEVLEQEIDDAFNQIPAIYDELEEDRLGYATINKEHTYGFHKNESTYDTFDNVLPTSFAHDREIFKSITNDRGQSEDELPDEYPSKSYDNYSPKGKSSEKYPSKGKSSEKYPSKGKSSEKYPAKGKSSDKYISKDKSSDEVQPNDISSRVFDPEEYSSGVVPTEDTSSEGETPKIVANSTTPTKSRKNSGGDLVSEIMKMMEEPTSTIRDQLDEYNNKNKEALSNILNIMEVVDIESIIGKSFALKELSAHIPALIKVLQSVLELRNNIKFLLRPNSLTIDKTKAYEVKLILNIKLYAAKELTILLGKINWFLSDDRF